MEFRWASWLIPLVGYETVTRGFAFGGTTQPAVSLRRWKLRVSEENSPTEVLPKPIPDVLNTDAFV